MLNVYIVSDFFLVWHGLLPMILKLGIQSSLLYLWIIWNHGLIFWLCTCRSIIKYTDIWTIWAYICFVCPLLFWHTSLNKVSCVQPQLLWQDLYLSSWSSGNLPRLLPGCRLYYCLNPFCNFLTFSRGLKSIACLFSRTFWLFFVIHIIIHFLRHPFSWIIVFPESTYLLKLLSILQLLLSSWKRSMLPGICGILAGALYRTNILRIRRVKVVHVIFVRLFPLWTKLCCQLSPLSVEQFCFISFWKLSEVGWD